MSSPLAAPTRIFLLSPAHLGGKRAALLLGGRAGLRWPSGCRAGGTITLGEAFSFLSGLYFRGKLTYARRFARPPAGVLGVQVITSNRGLLPAGHAVTAQELRAFADDRDPARRAPLPRAPPAGPDGASTRP